MSTATRISREPRAFTPSAARKRRFRSWAAQLQATPVTGSIGSGYASFLLGDVSNQVNVNAPKDTMLRRITEGLYAQDQFRATSKLTLEIGLRWDRTPLGTELWNRESEIGLNTSNPNAGNVPGGFIFAGSGPGRCNCEFSKTYNLAIGPRLSAGVPDQQENRLPCRLGPEL